MDRHCNAISSGSGSAGGETVSLDRSGTAVYYTMGEERYFLDGHTGAFAPVAAAVADIYEAAASPDPEGAWARAETCGIRSARAVRDLRRLRERSAADADDSRQEAFLRRMKPWEFTVYLARDCNLACRYCFNAGGTFGDAPSVMNEETARQVLSFISGIVREGVHPLVKVNLFGGEPLLAREATRVLVRGLQDLNHASLRTKVHLLLFTNGTLYDAEIFRILAERSDRCTVMTTLDGTRENHDRNRPFAAASGGSTFDAVLGNLRRMEGERIPFSVTCVVLWPFDFVAASEALHDLGIRCLEIKEPLFHAYGRRSPEDVLHTEFSRWRENYRAYCDYYLEHLRRPEWVRHTDRLSLPAHYRSMLFHRARRRIGLACRLAEIRVGITPRGEIMPCVSFLRHERYGLGNVGSGFDPIRYGRFEQWLLAHGQRRIDHPRCRSCFAKLVCGGGCYAESLDRSGTLDPGAGECAYVRERVKMDLHFVAQLRSRYPVLYHTLLAAAPC